MMDRVKLAKWFAMLAKLVRPDAPEETAKALMAYAPMLDDVDPGILDLKLLEDVSAACTFPGTPPYAKVRGFMDARMEALKPKLTSNSHTSREMAAAARRDDERREAVDDWSDPSVVLAAGRQLDGHPMRKLMGGLLSALVQRHAPGNLQYLPPEFLGG